MPRISLTGRFNEEFKRIAAVKRNKSVRPLTMLAMTLTIIFSPFGEEHASRLKPEMYDSTSDPGRGAHAMVTVQV